MKDVVVQVKPLDHHEGLPLPRYLTVTASGMDLHAALAEPVTIAPGQRALIPTGLLIALPAGAEAQIRPRSGLALDHGVTVLNAPGTVDADYRGEIKVLLINLGQRPFKVYRGDRIAQMVINPVLRGVVRQEEDLGDTKRGPGGFGHTGR